MLIRRFWWRLYAVHDAAQSPLFFEELDRLLKCRLVRRGMVVAFAFAGACVWESLEKPGYLYGWPRPSSVEHQDRYIDFPECFCRQGTPD